MRYKINPQKYEKIVIEYSWVFKTGIYDTNSKKDKINTVSEQSFYMILKLILI